MVLTQWLRLDSFRLLVTLSLIIFSISAFQLVVDWRDSQTPLIASEQKFRRFESGVWLLREVLKTKPQADRVEYLRRFADRCDLVMSIWSDTGEGWEVSDESLTEAQQQLALSVLAAVERGRCGKLEVAGDTIYTASLRFAENRAVCLLSTNKSRENKWLARVLSGLGLFISLSLLVVTGSLFLQNRRQQQLFDECLQLSQNQKTEPEAASERVWLSHAEDLEQTLLKLRAFLQSRRGIVDQATLLGAEIGEVTQTQKKLVFDANIKMIKHRADAERVVRSTRKLQAQFSRIGREIGAAHQAIKASQTSVEGAQTNVTRAVDSIEQMGTDFALVERQMTEMASVTGMVAQSLREIQAIARQTKVLAINTAVEAARGEKSQSFAVIAREVQGLANRAQNTTEETRLSVVALDTSVAIINDSISQFGRRVRKAVNDADSVHKLLNELIDSITSFTLMVEAIESVSREQEQSMDDFAAKTSQLTDLAGELVKVIQGSIKTNKSLVKSGKDLTKLLKNK